MESAVTSLALALDTLPQSGRVLLLAVLLSGLLCRLVRWLPSEVGAAVNLLYRKGALLALLWIPALVFLIGFKLPVPVDHVPALTVHWPSIVVWVLVSVWAIGVVIGLCRVALRLRRTHDVARSSAPAPDKLVHRLEHWRHRLDVGEQLHLGVSGSEMPWHCGTWLPLRHSVYYVVLPQAAANWPMGVIDVMLLSQLAQIKQRSWRWLWWGELVRVLYWLMPWVAGLARRLTQHSIAPAFELAAAAYRDADGWRRDLRQYDQRVETLDWQTEQRWLRLPVVRTPDLAPPQDDWIARLLRRDWVAQRRLRAQTRQDPHEQAYWLIAVATVIAAVVTTPTLVKAPPKFEPEFLDIKWHQQMVRTIREYHEEQQAPVGGQQAQDNASQQPSST